MIALSGLIMLLFFAVSYKIPLLAATLGYSLGQVAPTPPVPEITPVNADTVEDPIPI